MHTNHVNIQYKQVMQPSLIPKKKEKKRSRKDSCQHSLITLPPTYIVSCSYSGYINFSFLFNVQSLSSQPSNQVHSLSYQHPLYYHWQAPFLNPQMERIQSHYDYFNLYPKVTCFVSLLTQCLQSSQENTKLLMLVIHQYLA